MYQDKSTQSQDQGCFMFKTLGIFFQWILKIWIHSILLQCSTAVDIIYQQKIEYIYYLYISVFELDVQISMEQIGAALYVYLTSGHWRRTGRKGPNVTNLQQICNINIAAAAPCCTLAPVQLQNVNLAIHRKKSSSTAQRHSIQY